MYARTHVRTYTHTYTKTHARTRTNLRNLLLVQLPGPGTLIDGLGVGHGVRRIQCCRVQT
jgi:hypothetical protein